MFLGKGGSLKNSYFWWREELRRDSVVVWFMDRQGVGMWVWVIMGMMRESQYLHNIPQPNLTLKQPGLYWVSAWKKLSTYPSRVQSFVSIKSKWKWPWLCHSYPVKCDKREFAEHSSERFFIRQCVNISWGINISVIFRNVCGDGENHFVDSFLPFD